MEIFSTLTFCSCLCRQSDTINHGERWSFLRSSEPAEKESRSIRFEKVSHQNKQIDNEIVSFNRMNDDRSANLFIRWNFYYSCFLKWSVKMSFRVDKSNHYIAFVLCPLFGRSIGKIVRWRPVQVFSSLSHWFCGRFSRRVRAQSGILSIQYLSVVRSAWSVSESHHDRSLFQCLRSALRIQTSRQHTL